MLRFVCQLLILHIGRCLIYAVRTRDLESWQIQWLLVICFLTQHLFIFSPVEKILLYAEFEFPGICFAFCSYLLQMVLGENLQDSRRYSVWLRSCCSGVLSFSHWDVGPIFSCSLYLIKVTQRAIRNQKDVVLVFETKIVPITYFSAYKKTQTNKPNNPPNNYI